MSYQSSQQVGSISLNNGVTESYTYSAGRLQLTSQTAIKSGNNTLMSLTYNYVAPKSRSGGVGSVNANTGQLMDITSSQINGQQRNESYNYDQVARLKQASGFYPQLNYTYDRFGNRTGVSGATSQTVTLQQSGGVTNNRIATVNGITYGYDAAGDVTNDGLSAYAFDAECRIVSVDSGSTAIYSYDAVNRRVKKVAGGYTTYYVWEGSNVIAEYSNAPASGGGTRFYHPDRLSNRMITDASGGVKGSMDNLPFGQDGGSVGETEKHRFTSYERDSETGTDYAMNRQNSTATGRFLRTDPVPAVAANPQGFNRYVYVQNNPVNAVDPLGLTLSLDCEPRLSGGNGEPLSSYLSCTLNWTPNIGPSGTSDQGGNTRPAPVGYSPNKLLAQCYAGIVAGYVGAGGTVNQKVVDVLKSLSPTSIVGGILGGIQGFNNPGYLSDITRIGPESRALSGARGVGKGLLGVGSGYLGAILSGVGIGGALTILGDSLIGREAYFRQGIESCNKANPNATDKVSPGFFQVFSSNIEAVAGYLAKYK